MLNGFVCTYQNRTKCIMGLIATLRQIHWIKYSLHWRRVVFISNMDPLIKTSISIFLLHSKIWLYSFASPHTSSKGEGDNSIDSTVLPAHNIFQDWVWRLKGNRGGKKRETFAGLLCSEWALNKALLKQRQRYCVPPYQRIYDCRFSIAPFFSCPEQLEKSSCLSVGRSVGRSVGLWKNYLQSIRW